MTWFQRLLLLTIAATFVLVVAGGTVRATDSGLGCPDWPACHGRIIPPAEKHTLIEFSHRTLAAGVGFMFLGVTYFAFKTERRRPLVFWLAATAGVLLIVQIVLGGITVKRELPAEIVAAHLATAMAFMGVLIATAVISLANSRGRPANDGWLASPFARLAMLSAATAFVTLVLGSYMSGTAASLACEGWPLCDGAVVPAGDATEGLHFLHRAVAGLLGLMLAATAYQAWEERRPTPVIAGCVAACALYITQALIGAANVWTRLADGVVVAHLSLAALLWCGLVALCALSAYARGVRAVSGGDEAAAAKVTQWAR